MIDLRRSISTRVRQLLALRRAKTTSGIVARTHGARETAIPIDEFSAAPLNAPVLTAFRVTSASAMRVVPAPAEREWMQATAERFANRCLPLLVANQSGWLILNSHKVLATWDGGDGLTSVHLQSAERDGPLPACSHFGYGIITWTLPFLFRTPPGYNLLVRGPANWPKDGVYPLEGVVETDWSVATFTVNWKLTHPNKTIAFEVGEPICMLVPQRRGELESFRPEIRDIGIEPTTLRQYGEWSQGRSRFLTQLRQPGSFAVKHRWQKDYFQGKFPDGRHVQEHQTRLKLRQFVES